MATTPDFYAVLGVNRSATADEIKSAYRARAKAYHPDGNAGGGDPERFSRLNEAYEVLRDPERRARYDASFYDPPEQKAQPEPLEPICCSACGKITAQPRYAVFWTVVSVLVATWRTPTQGIYCSPCARRKAFRCSAISAAAGWWGVWGIIWTPISIIRNALGGEQPAGSGIRMLWYNALAFWSQGKLATAHALAKMVARSRSDLSNDAVLMLKELQRAGVPADTPAFTDAWRYSFGGIAAHGAMLAAVPLVVTGLILSDGRVATSGNRTYVPPPAVAEAATTIEATPTVAAVEPEPAPVPTCGHEVPSGKLLSGNLASEDFGHRLEIKNGSESPAIIKVRNADTGRVVVSFYVQKDDHADIGPLPDGTYRIQFATGEALAADCKSFVRILGASEFPTADTFQIEQRGDQLIAQHLTYTLYAVPAGNVRPDTIEAAAFDAN